jgi:hypothetical protein
LEGKSGTGWLRVQNARMVYDWSVDIYQAIISRNHRRHASVILTKEKVIMKKFIQVCSLLSILVLTSVFPVTAQGGFGTEVEIPFAFNVGDREYEAGAYIIKLSRISAGTATLSIHDPRNDELQTVLVNVNSETSRGNDIRLVFDTIDGQKHLTKVRTADKTFALAKPKSEKNAKVRDAENQVENSIGVTADLF